MIKTNINFRRFTILLVFFVMGLTSCDETFNLRSSEFIEDTEFEGLPIYSEWGYNTFGAYYDRAPFTSGSEIPFKIVNTNDTTSLLFNGKKLVGISYEYYSDNTYQAMKMIIKLSDFNPTSITDLLALNDTVVELDNDMAEVNLNIDGAMVGSKIIKGEINFVRSQRLSVNGAFREIILSGYFNLQILVNAEPISITNGRFDVGVDNSNFFIY